MKRGNAAPVCRLWRGAVAFEDSRKTATRDGNTNERNLPEFEQCDADECKKAKLLGGNPADQRGKAEFGKPVVRRVEVLVALALFVVEGGEKLRGVRLVGCDRVLRGHEIELEITFAPER